MENNIDSNLNYCMIGTSYFRINGLSSIGFLYATDSKIDIFFSCFELFAHTWFFLSLIFFYCRESKGRKCSLPVYNDDEDANDFNGFGYRANDTINGRGSVSEDYENQSVNVSILIGFFFVTNEFFSISFICIIQLLLHSSKNNNLVMCV